jgi:hypothetical protein
MLSSYAGAVASRPRPPFRRTLSRIVSRLCFPVAVAIVTTGCHSQPPPAHELDIPPIGSVRIIARQIEQTDRRMHWKWSLIGERNWSRAATTGTDLTLANTYPINDPETRGGCNIWECDLVVERAEAPGGAASGAGGAGLEWSATLHGSDGVTAKSGGPLPGDPHALDDAVSIRQSDDTDARLPADVTLATVGGHPVVLHIAK